MTRTEAEIEETHAPPAHPGQTIARRLVIAAGVGFGIVLLALTLAGGLPLVDAVLLTVLLVLVPGLSLAQVPLISGAEIERLPAYWASIGTLGLLGAACWFVGTRSGGPAAIGIVGLSPLSMLVWSVGLTLAGLGVILVFRAISIRMGVPDTPLLRALLPQTPRERRVFAVLSLAAGSGEEVAYRGYLISGLAPLLGVGGAVALSSAVFGVLHAYQGWLGVLRTGLMGGVLAGGFVASGSLWPPLVAHVLIDLLAGIVLGDRLLSPSVDIGVSPPPRDVPPEQPEP